MYTVVSSFKYTNPWNYLNMYYQKILFSFWLKVTYQTLQTSFCTQSSYASVVQGTSSDQWYIAVLQKEIKAEAAGENYMILETQPLIAVRCSQRSAKYNPPLNLNGSSQNVSENDDDWILSSNDNLRFCSFLLHITFNRYRIILQ